MRLALLLLPALAFGQIQEKVGPSFVAGTPTLFPVSPAIRATASFSPQFPAPHIKGIWLYSATVCNNRAEAITLDAGHIIQAGQSRKLDVIDPSLVDAVASKSRRRSPLYIVTETLRFACAGAAILLAAEVISATPQLAVIAPLCFLGTDRFQRELDTDSPYGSLRDRFLAGTLTLAPSGCESRLILGRYVKGQSETVIVGIQ